MTKTLDSLGRTKVVTSSPTPLEEILLASRGLISETIHANAGINGTTLTSQQVTWSILPLRAGQVVTKLHIYVQTAPTGAAPTTMKLGLWTAVSATNILTCVAVTANTTAASSWPVGLTGIAVGSPYTVPADGGYFVGMLLDGAWGGTALSVGTLLTPSTAARVTGYVPTAYTASGVTAMNVADTQTGTDSRRLMWFGVS